MFYGDYYGIPHNNIGAVGPQLETLLRLRQEVALGEQNRLSGDFNIIGWTRAGDEAHPGLGLCCHSFRRARRPENDVRRRAVCRPHLLGNCPGEVVLDESGSAAFAVNGGSVSVWGPRPE